MSRTMTPDIRPRQPTARARIGFTFTADNRRSRRRNAAGFSADEPLREEIPGFRA